MVLFVLVLTGEGATPPPQNTDFALIASSPLRINLSCVLDQVITELTTFLRKANRALRQATLGTLNALVVAYGDQISPSAYEVIVVELSALISDTDLNMTALALELCCTLMTDRKSSQNVGLTIRCKVLPQALILIRSSLLQGQPLHALQKFFASLVHSSNTSFDALLESLLSSAKPSPQFGGLAKHALYSIPQCVVVLCLAAGDHKCASIVEMLKSILKDDSSTSSDGVPQTMSSLQGRLKKISEATNPVNAFYEDKVPMSILYPTRSKNTNPSTPCPEAVVIMNT